jgi:hypothetical protein
LCKQTGGKSAEIREMLILLFDVYEIKMGQFFKVSLG